MRDRGIGANSVLLILIYWAMQAVAAVVFKTGSMAQTSAGWWSLFAFGHVFGAGSIVFQMVLYRRMNPNVALGICVGGAFLSAQIATAIVFSSRLAPLQWIGLLSITAGMLMLALGKPARPAEPVRDASEVSLATG